MRTPKILWWSAKKTSSLAEDGSDSVREFIHDRIRREMVRRRTSEPMSWSVAMTAE